FVALGVLGAVGIAKSVGVLTDSNGEIIVDGRGMTNIDGLYAIGDCTAGIKQVARAVNDGMIVGTDILKRLKNR
ncbi:MAG: NAD(P)/FAD-dependent oxidoreductase, partial [Clostridiales bacterium]|nr:NAD(P)/FAD-dependent oxidoreductase [Clostridiales bacterium]